LADHPAPSAIAPAGADLRVVARVRMVTPARRVANLRVAMRVQVTERDEDMASLVRAIKGAVRRLLLVATVMAALTRTTVVRVARAARELAPASVPAPVATGQASWPVLAASHRTPRPALAAAVLSSPD
jgi:hypothetical protein